MIEELLREMEAYAEAEHVPIIRSEASAILVQAAREKRPKHILEIGTAIGYSALLLAETLADGGRITTIEISEERAELAKAYLARTPYADRIRIVCGDAEDVLPALEETYDFVFIDAAKGQYERYLSAILARLEDGAVIAADNVLFRGYVLGKEKETPRRFKTIVKRLREFLAMLDSDPAFSAVEIYPDGDGMAICCYHPKAKK